jgi:hypothetical protein
MTQEMPITFGIGKSGSLRQEIAAFFCLASASAIEPKCDVLHRGCQAGTTGLRRLYVCQESVT